MGLIEFEPKSPRSILEIHLSRRVRARSRAITIAIAIVDVARLSEKFRPALARPGRGVLALRRDGAWLRHENSGRHPSRDGGSRSVPRRTTSGRGRDGRRLRGRALTNRAAPRAQGA